MLISLMYFIFGILFTYLAYTYATDTVWNPFTIILLLVATIDFGASYRYARKFIKKFNDMNNEQ